MPNNRPLTVRDRHSLSVTTRRGRALPVSLPQNHNQAARRLLEPWLRSRKSRRLSALPFSQMRTLRSPRCTSTHLQLSQMMLSIITLTRCPRKLSGLLMCSTRQTLSRSPSRRSAISHPSSRTRLYRVSNILRVEAALRKIKDIIRVPVFAI